MHNDGMVTTLAVEQSPVLKGTFHPREKAYSMVLAGGA
jgi:hypothetical protein